MALKKMKESVERVFDKNLNDLVRGIRAHKEDEAKFIATCIDEIKMELRQESMDVKANALLKLVYLQMLGYDISWACFNMVEVTSSGKFTFKRIGYLAASQAFREDTDVIMLTTNLIKKDLGSSQMYDAANSLTGLSCFMTPDLAQDLTQDIMSLLSSSKPYIRKKAVLIMYKVFLKYPEALRLAYPKLKERLDDDDPGVQCAAVNVICELARKNPKNYLALAPKFFGIMTNSTNNWMLIKIIKLFGALTPLEPRLGKKLVEPLTNLIHSTSAMSLLYECINTVVAVLISISSGLPQHNSSIQLCVQKLKILIEDNDQNLKYLGLLAMGNILKTHPKSVQPLKDLVLTCLDDKDESIRFRALDLLYGMINKRNLMEIVKKLMSHIEKAEGTQYRDELLSKIIEVCSHDNYQHITNFEWYISILVELTKMEGTRHGKLISAQMLDVAVRVRSIRQFTVTQMALLVENNNLLNGAIRRTGISEVLYAAGWIAGEFNIYLSDPRTTLMAMLRERVVELPATVQAVYVQNALKLYSKLIVDLRAKLSDDNKEEEEKEQEDPENSAEVKRQIRELTSAVLAKLPQFSNSPHMEVQERACMAMQILKYIEKYIDKDDEVVEDFRVLFAEDLNPVAPRAQRKVPVPKGLDLDEWINAPPSSSEEDDVPGAASSFIDDKTYGAASGTRAISTDYSTPTLGNFYKSKELTEEELSRAKEEREKYVSGNMYYLKGSNSSSKTGSPGKKPLKGGTSVTTAGASEMDIQLDIPGFSLTEAEKKAMKKKKSKSKKSKKNAKGGGDGGYGGDSDEMNEDDNDYPVVDIVAEDMPEGALESDEDDRRLRDLNDPHRLLNFDDLEAAITFDDEKKSDKKKKKEKEMEKESKNKKKSTKTTEDTEEVVEKKKKKKVKGEDMEATVRVKEETRSSKIGEEPTSKRSSKTKDKSPKEDREVVASKPAEETTKDKQKSSKKKLLKEVANMEEEVVVEEAGDVEEGEVRKKKKKDGKEGGKSKREKGSKKKDKTGDDAVGVKSTAAEGDLIDASGFEDTVPNSNSLVDISAAANHQQAEPTDDISFWLDGTGGSSKPGSGGLQGGEEGEGATDFYLSLDGIDISATAPTLSSNLFPQFEFLAKDSNICAECKVELECGNDDSVQVVLRVRNCSQQSSLTGDDVTTTAAAGKTLKKVELIISDGVNLKMHRLGSSSAHDPVLVSQKLLIGEQVDKSLKYTFKDIYWPQKVKGTITYIALTEDSSTHDKVDFKVNLPVSSFLMPLPMDGSSFKNLLASGELTDKCSVTVETHDIFTTFLAKFCHYLHFTVVEQIVESASLYSKSAYGDHICVLLKASPSGGAVCCDMKCSTEKLLKHLQSEIEALPSK